jgi:hypothetical protein
MSKILPPTIGRRVWYWPSDYDLGLLENKPTSTMVASDRTQACDAGICCVWGDRCVNLTVADHNGNMHARTSVTLVQAGDALPVAGSYATWMPHQLGQVGAQPPALNAFVAPGAELFGQHPVLAGVQAMNAPA